jgi:APA family basic amino acid/polyamine antiporter
VPPEYRRYIKLKSAQAGGMMRPPDARPALGLIDAVSLVVGIIIGSGIFMTPPGVFANVSEPFAGLAVWLIGGALAAIGALVYAELATAYPSPAGEYVYFRRAYGQPVAFAFAWAQLAVIRTGASLAPIAYVFADYADRLYSFGPHSKLIYAAAAIGGLSVINALGIHPGRRTQNLLTLAKILGLGGLIGAGLWLGGGSEQAPAVTPRADTSLTLAFVLVLWTYSGWHEAAYVVADLRDRSHNLVRALLLGVAAVTGIYLLVNYALLAGLGFEGVRSSKTVASDLLGRALGPSGETAMAWLVIVSTLGATNGLILTGGRFFAGFGALHPGFGWLGGLRTDRGAPLVALAAQAAISLGMIALVDTAEGDSFEALLVCTGPVFWFFFLLTGTALFVLRVREPDQPRPFRVPFLPVIGGLFCAACLFMLFQSGAYALMVRPTEAVVVTGLLAAGLPVYLLGRHVRQLRTNN